MIKAKYILLLVVGFLILPAAAFAQVRSNSQGLYLNLHANGSSIRVEDADDAESGGGLGFNVGWGFSPKIMLLIGGASADVDAIEDDPDFFLTHGDIGVRYTFANAENRFIPYLQASLTGRIITYETDIGEDVDISGAGFSIGGGVSYYISRTFALEAGLLFTGGKFTDIEVGDDSQSLDEDFSATSTRFDIGISWYPIK